MGRVPKIHFHVMSIEKENCWRYESNVKILDINLNFIGINIYKCYTSKFGYLPSRFRKLHREKQIEFIHFIIFRINKNSERERERWHTTSSSWRQTGSEARPKRGTRTLSMVSLMIASTSCFFVSTVNRKLLILSTSRFLGSSVILSFFFFRQKITYKKKIFIVSYSTMWKKNL